MDRLIRPSPAELAAEGLIVDLEAIRLSSERFWRALEAIDNGSAVLSEIWPSAAISDEPYLTLYYAGEYDEVFGVRDEFVFATVSAESTQVPTIATTTTVTTTTMPREPSEEPGREEPGREEPSREEPGHALSEAELEAMIE